TGLHEVAGRVLDVCLGHAGLHHVGELDVAEGAAGCAYGLRNALVAAAADTGGPLDRLGDADVRLPLARNLAEVVGGVVRGGPAVRSVDDLDRAAGQRDAGVNGRDRRVVPLRDEIGR